MNNDDTITPSSAPPPSGVLWLDQDTARMLIVDHGRIVGSLVTGTRRVEERLARIEAGLAEVRGIVAPLAVERVAEAGVVLELRRQSLRATAEADHEVSAAQGRQRAAQAVEEAERAELRAAAVDTATAGVQAAGSALRSSVAPWIILALASGLAGLGAGQVDLLGALARLSPPPTGADHGSEVAPSP